MDAMLDEKLDVEGFWTQYVGNLTPLEFMNRQYTPDIRECAEAYVEGLPHVFGIVRRQTWKSSFEAPWQFRKGEVMAAIIEKLEATEAEWRPSLNQRPAPEPTPEPLVVSHDNIPSTRDEPIDADTQIVSPGPVEQPAEDPAGVFAPDVPHVSDLPLQEADTAQAPDTTLEIADDASAQEVPAQEESAQ